MRILRLFALASLLVVASNAKATCGSAYPDTDPLTGAINVGAFGRTFTVLAKSDVNFLNNSSSGNAFVQGNIGIGQKGNFSLSGNASIDGDLYMNSVGQFSMSGNAHFTAGHGVKNNQDSLLSSAITDYQNLSDAACGETPTPAYASITNVSLSDNQSMTITGAPGQKVVLSLQNFSLTGNSTFTLQGTATTSFIINLAKGFSLSGNSQILLAGVPPKNVLFNIRGTGSDVTLSGSSTMSGILLALNRKVALSGNAIVKGRVIGDQFNISGGAQVISR